MSRRKNFLLLCAFLLVGCDGVLGSELRFDKCGVCGGNDSSCHIISGIFTRTKLPNGYNKVTTIPRGACNLNITELTPSRNRLAVKGSNGEFIVNGNWAMGASNEYDGAGTVFKYHHPVVTDGVLDSLEYVLAPGPINTSIDVMVVQEQENRGIMYTYTISLHHARHHHQHHHGGRRHSSGHPNNVEPTDSGPSRRDEKEKSNRFLDETQSDQVQIADRYRSYQDVLRRQREQQERLTKNRPADRSEDYPVYGLPHSQKPATNTSSKSLPGGQPQPGINYGLHRPVPQPYVGSQYQSEQGVRYGGQLLPGGSAGQNWYPGYQQPVGYGVPPVQPYGPVPQPYDGVGYNRLHSRYGSFPLNDQTALPGTADQSAFLGGAEFAWKITGFTDCSKSCGGGVQSTMIVCMKLSNVQVIVTNDNCDPASQPVGRTVTCNNNPCPPGWEPSEWSDCSTTCNAGQQTRTVECKHRVSATLSISVSASKCHHEPRPETVRTCNHDRPCYRWKIGEWSQCSTECGRGQYTREVVCVGVEDKPIAENKCDGAKPKTAELCDMGSCAKTWFYTEWSQQCSTQCGEGVHLRRIHCSAEVQRCNEINRPKSEKPCKQELPCGGTWFTGPWRECAVTCGEGVTTRDIVCMKKLGPILAVVGEENCLASEKPETQQPCGLEPCRPQWYMTDWSECSRSCDTGLRTREVKCLDANQDQSQLCTSDEKPELRQTCNTNPCLPRSHNNQRDSTQSSESCIDKFRNCRVVVQARLCPYAYYKEVCCFSCISHGYDDT